ncbi:MAG: hypothetical protein FWD45_01995 [Coriobacteriia bacterium]|nr:hypothetical protein [Coriobacteriia bacterium]
MSDKYYLMSKDIGDGPYLIGELTRTANSEYQFRYLIKGSRFPHWFMQIPRMNEIDKTYQTREVLGYILYRVVPEEDEWAADVLMQQNNITSYDEWTILESLIAQHERYRTDNSPLSDSQQLFYFYKEVPENAHTFY